jgi:hypothetical protein
MFMTSHDWRVPRRIAGVAVAVMSVGLLAPAAASATAPTTTSSTEVDTGTIDCGAFFDNFVDFFTITETTFYDTQGTATRVVDQITHSSNDVNSVTGLTLHEHGHATFTFYPASGQVDLNGLLFMMTRPTYGIVVEAVGRLVFDGQGNLVQLAGHFQAEDQDYCNGLA